MTDTQTTATKTNRYLTALVTLALVASLLAVLAVRPAHADGEFIFKVNSTGDFADISHGDEVCDVDLAIGNTCTLRAAIQETNATPETDIIAFDIPAAFRNPTSGVATISPGTALPPITKPVRINGYSQPGSALNTLAVGDNAAIKVELDGSKVAGTTPVDGLRIVDSSGSLIRGLAINGFSGDGIFVSGDTSSGPTIAFDNLIEGNFIGTDPSGKGDKGNLTNGVTVGRGAFGTTVGGTSRSERNVISGNDIHGVFVVGGSSGTRVEGNYIGTDKSGKIDLGNKGVGVFAFSGRNNNTIGGTTAGAGNVISGNGQSGVGILDSNNNAVLGNRIGTTAGGTAPLGNTGPGVAVGSASGTFVGDGSTAGANTIAFNGDDGVFIGGGDHTTANRVLSNSIFSNAGLGIDLLGGFEDASGKTANDPGDVDSGPNGLQNKPVVSSARTSTTATTIRGNLTSTPNKTFVVRFFSNPAGTDEGKTFVGQKSVSTEGSGKATFTKALAKVSVGRSLTATATSPGGDTSEFSAPRTVASS